MRACVVGVFDICGGSRWLGLSLEDIPQVYSLIRRFSLPPPAIASRRFPHPGLLVTRWAGDTFLRRFESMLIALSVNKGAGTAWPLGFQRWNPSAWRRGAETCHDRRGSIPPIGAFS